MLRVRAVVLASALILAPFGAWGADLVVWWDKGFYPQEDAAVREIIAAFEQKTGKQVELVQFPQIEMFQRAQAALEAGQAPDFLFGTSGERWVAQWAHQNRLVDLEGTLGPVLGLFDADTLDTSTLLDGNTGRRGLYALPMGRHALSGADEHGRRRDPRRRPQVHGQGEGRRQAVLCVIR